MVLNRKPVFLITLQQILEKEFGMINKYEERLGTERMLPLVFKMALPAVAAQFVNLLL